MADISFIANFVANLSTAEKREAGPEGPEDPQVSGVEVAGSPFSPILFQLLSTYATAPGGFKVECPVSSKEPQLAEGGTEISANPDQQAPEEAVSKELARVGQSNLCFTGLTIPPLPQVRKGSDVARTPDTGEQNAADGIAPNLTAKVIPDLENKRELVRADIPQASVDETSLVVRVSTVSRPTKRASEPVPATKNDDAETTSGRKPSQQEIDPTLKLPEAQAFADADSSGEVNILPDQQNVPRTPREQTTHDELKSQAKESITNPSIASFRLADEPLSVISPAPNQYPTHAMQRTDVPASDPQPPPRHQKMNQRMEEHALGDETIARTLFVGPHPPKDGTPPTGEMAPEQIPFQSTVREYSTQTLGRRILDGSKPASIPTTKVGEPPSPADMVVMPVDLPENSKSMQRAVSIAKNQGEKEIPARMKMSAISESMEVGRTREVAGTTNGGASETVNHGWRGSTEAEPKPALPTRVVAAHQRWDSEKNIEEVSPVSLPPLQGDGGRIVSQKDSRAGSNEKEHESKRVEVSTDTDVKSSEPEQASIALRNPLSETAASPKEHAEILKHFTGVIAAKADLHQELSQALPIKPSPLPSELLSSVQDQIAKEITLKVAGNVSEIRVMLKPESLGTVTVHVRMDEGTVVAHIDTSQQIVRSALEANLPQLRETLSGRGIQVDRIDVTTSGFASFRESGNHHRERAKSGARHADDADAAESYESARYLGYNTLDFVV